MNNNECIKTRRSIRQFSTQKVSHETLESIVDVARYAPSWKNTQIVRYYFIENPTLKSEIAASVGEMHTGNQAIIENCPVLVIEAFVKKRSGYERDGSFTTAKEDRWEMYDSGIAAEAFCLAAHDAGVGTVIMGIFDEKKIATIANIPEEQGIAALIAVGYPANPDVTAPPRKAVEDLVIYK